jgi:hypothetical protein
MTVNLVIGNHHGEAASIGGEAAVMLQKIHMHLIH